VAAPIDIAIALTVVLVAAIAFARLRDLRRGAGTPDLRLLPDSSSSIRYFVTLVHGTWLRGFLDLDSTIPWYREKSDLCKELARQDTLIYRFSWSGANSVAARFKAATKLTEEVSPLLSKYATATHVIVAHSRGANVALLALQDSAIAARTASMVSLSAPFVRVSVRRILTDDESVSTMQTVLVLTVVGMVFLSLSLPAWLLGWASAAAYLTLVVALIVAWRMRVLLAGLRRRAEALVRQLQTPPCKGLRLLIVRPVADEASGVLVADQFLRWVAEKIEALSYAGLVSTFSFAVLFQFLYSAWTWKWYEGINHLFPVIALSTLAIGSQMIRVLMAAPFGFRPTLSMMLLDLSAEVSPEGKWEIIQAPPSMDPRAFNHSLTWSDPKLIARSTEWLFAGRYDS